MYKKTCATMLISLLISSVTAQAPRGNGLPMMQNNVINNGILIKGDRMAPNFGLDKAAREESGKLLNILLADEYLLYTKTYNYHWNVVGLMFNDLHKFFEGQYEQLEGFVDATAERVRAVGIRALGTMGEFLKYARLKEDAPGTVPEAKQMIKNLLDDHETIISSLRIDLDRTAEINDMGTNNFLNDLLMKHEKMAWMLRSYLQ